MKNVSRFIISLILAIFSLSVLVHADVALKLDGNPIPFEQPPVIVEGRTLVPFRAIFEALGAEVEWDDSTKTATAVKEDLTVKITIGENVLYKNGEKVELDVPAMIVGEGYTMVPARAIAEAFGVVVEWEDTAQYVILITPEIKDEVPVITMYSADGRTITVAKSAVEEYKKVGWYVEPVVQMWKPDGTSKYVFTSLVEEYILLGWYTEPVVLMWAYDGRSMYVLESQVEANKAVGWYENKADVMETVYAPDGRTQEVFKAFVDREKSVGWMDRDEFEEYLQPWVEAYKQVVLLWEFGGNPCGKYLLAIKNSEVVEVFEIVPSSSEKSNAFRKKHYGNTIYGDAQFPLGKTHYTSIDDAYNYIKNWFSDKAYSIEENKSKIESQLKLYDNAVFCTDHPDYWYNVKGNGIYLGAEGNRHYMGMLRENGYGLEFDILELSNVNGKLLISDYFSTSTSYDADTPFILSKLNTYYSDSTLNYTSMSADELAKLTFYLVETYRQNHQIENQVCSWYEITIKKEAPHTYYLQMKTANLAQDIYYDIRFSSEKGIPVITYFSTRVVEY